MELLIKLFVVGCLAIATIIVWRFELRRRIIVTPFVFAMYYFWLRHIPTYVVATDIGLSATLYSFVVGCVSLFVFLVGFVLGGYRLRAIRGYAFEASQQLGQQADLKRLEPGIWLLGVVLVLCGLYFYQGLPDAFRAMATQALSGGSRDLAVEVRNARFELSKSAYFGGESRGQGFFSVLLELGWPIVVSYFLIAFSKFRTKRLFVMLVMSAIAALVFISGMGSRAPTLNVIMMILAAYSLWNPLRLKAVLLSAIGIVVVAIAAGAFSTKMHYLLTDPGLDSIARALSDVADRIVLSNASNDVRIIELVHGGEWDLRWGGENVRNFIAALPGINYGVPVSYQLFLEYNPWSTSTTFYSGGYMSTVYVDFGFAGVVFLFALVGWTVGAIQRKYFSALSRRPGLLLVFAGPVFYVAAMILVSGFSSLVARGVVLGLLMLVVVVGTKIRRRVR